MSMNPSASITTTITHRAITDSAITDSAITDSAILDAESHLHRAQEIVLDLWTSALPDLDGRRAGRLVAAHRAITEACTILDDPTVVVAPELTH